MRMLRIFQNISANKSGFTIIELLVVITMVGIVAGVGIFSLVNYGNAQSVEQATGKVKNLFDETKFNALSAVRLSNDIDGDPTNCPTEVTSYQINISQSEDAVSLYMNCGQIQNLIEYYTLPENLNFANETDCEEIIYNSVTLAITSQPTLPCDIIIDGYGQIKEIEIDTLGNFILQR